MRELMAQLSCAITPLPTAGALEAYVRSALAILPLRVLVTKGFPERIFANHVPASYAFREAVATVASETGVPRVLQITPADRPNSPLGLRFDSTAKIRTNLGPIPLPPIVFVTAFDSVSGDSLRDSTKMRMSLSVRPSITLVASMRPNALRPGNS